VSLACAVIGTPTDVNWTVLKYPDVEYASSLRVLVGSERSYTPARELSDAMSALVYNLDSANALHLVKGSAQFGGKTEAGRTWPCEDYCD